MYENVNVFRNNYPCACCCLVLLITFYTPLIHMLASPLPRSCFLTHVPHTLISSLLGKKINDNGDTLIIRRLSVHT